VASGKWGEGTGFGMGGFGGTSPGAVSWACPPNNHDSLIWRALGGISNSLPFLELALLRMVVCWHICYGGWGFVVH